MASSWIVCVLTVLLVVRWTSADGFTASTLDWLAGSKGATEAPSNLGRPVVCPAQCDCFNYRETVDCSRRNLERVPASLPPVVRRLYLEGNRIEELGGDGRLSAAGNDSVPPQTSRLSAASNNSAATVDSVPPAGNDSLPPQTSRLSAAGNLSVLIVEDNRLTELNVDALCRLVPRRADSPRCADTSHTVPTRSAAGARRQRQPDPDDRHGRPLRGPTLSAQGAQPRSRDGPASVRPTRPAHVSAVVSEELNLGHNRLTAIPANLSAMAPNLEILLQRIR